MSRTYRRKSRAGTMNDWDFRLSVYRIQDKTDAEIARLLSVYHSDSYDCAFKEPGPSWFRTLVTERPLRRKNKQELKKFLLNDDYEPMCEEKGNSSIGLCCTDTNMKMDPYGSIFIM